MACNRFTDTFPPKGFYSPAQNDWYRIAERAVVLLVGRVWFSNTSTFSEFILWHSSLRFAFPKNRAAMNKQTLANASELLSFATNSLDHLSVRLSLCVSLSLLLLLLFFFFFLLLLLITDGYRHLDRGSGYTREQWVTVVARYHE